MNIIKYKWFFLAISAILVLASLYAIFTFGFRQGIDFTGGSLWQLRAESTSSEQLKNFFENELKLPIASLSHDSSTGAYAVTLQQIGDAERQSALSALKTKLNPAIEEIDFWSVSPSVSNEIRERAMMAIGVVLVGISLYIAFVFRKVSRPVSSWKYGVITLLTLAHNVVIPAGLFAFLGSFLNLSIDTNFVVALLVVMGFSVHDTIVVFDRIRENIIKSRHTGDLAGIINRSVSETALRSVNTSLTLIFVLSTLYFMGPLSLKYFILTMLVGTTVGTYSSIFVASPMLTLFHREKR